MGDRLVDKAIAWGAVIEARRDERESCARIAERMGAVRVAEAIRSKGQLRGSSAATEPGMG